MSQPERSVKMLEEEEKREEKVKARRDKTRGERKRKEWNRGTTTHNHTHSQRCARDNRATSVQLLSRYAACRGFGFAAYSSAPVTVTVLSQHELYLTESRISTWARSTVVR